jgi:splicing factor 3A subunit 1
LDVDTIKLTAQFVARNGKPFLTQLTNKEQRNPMFDFLKPQHSHFPYFNKLVDQYTRILMPPRDLVDKMRAEVAAPFAVLRSVSYRVEWERAQQRERAKETEAAEKERVAYAQIDWHDFVVVETVDFQPNEVGNFPAPTTPAHVGARVIAQERLEAGGGGEEDMFMARILADESRSVEEPSSNVSMPSAGLLASVTLAPEIEDEAEAAAPVVTSSKKAKAVELPLPPNPDNVIIRRDYDPKNRGAGGAQPGGVPKPNAGGDQYFKSPITGELILGSMMEQHMRISMLNPDWIKQKQRGLLVLDNYFYNVCLEFKSFAFFGNFIFKQLFFF